MKDMNKKRKIDEAGSSNLTSKEEELRLLIEPLAKPVLVNLLSKLGSKDPSIAAEIETIAYGDHVHRKLFVRDLSLNTTSQSLCNAFKEYGQIEHAKVIVNEGTKKSRGYGYILYKDVKSAKKALHVPSKLIDGRLTLCMLASDEVTRKISDTTLRKLFIENLSPQVTNGMLHNYFKGHGDIEECSVVYHKDSKLSREYGFVTYKTVEAAKNAIKDLNKSNLEGRRINVEYAYPNKGGGGQSSVPPMAALPVPPGYTYPQTAALYAAPPYTYPQTAAPPYSYPQTAAPPYSYPQTAAPSNPYPQTAATPNPYPQTAAPYVAPPYPYPQMPAPYAASHYNSAPPGPSTYQTHGYGQGPYPQQYYQNQ
ncbi:UBP1-associated protein 2C-like [Trifolium pratense]|nr:UBP1-associated protein 2C-like [Trifolium pratense]